MRPITATVPLLALLSLTVGAVQAAPPTIPPPTPAVSAAPLANDRLQGQVVSVDSAKKTLVLHTQYGQTDKIVTLAPDAKIYVSGPGALSDLRIGDTIRAYGTATPEAPTLTATRIVQRPAAPVPPGKARPKAGFHKKYVEGTIATTTPGLTLTTPGGVTVTVTTDSQTKVTRLTTGTLDAVKVDATVQVVVNGSDAAPMASELSILPAKGQGNAGGGRRRKKNAPVAPVASVPTTLPAAP